MQGINSILDNSKKLAPAKRLLDEAEDVMPGAEVSYGLRTYSMTEFMEQQFPEPVWLVDKLIPEGLTLMSAPPATFKTWMLLDIAISIASGNSLFNHFSTLKSGVLMIDEESMPSMLQKRLNMLGADKDLPIHFMFEQNFKLDIKQVTRVIQFCEDNNIGLVTLDSLVRVHNARENDAMEMAEVFNQIRRFTKNGINVIVTHHNKKGGNSESQTEDFRGSSDIRAAVDCHIAVKKDDGRRLVLTQTKVRIAEESDPVELEIRSNGDHIEFDYIGTLKKAESKKTQTRVAVPKVLEIHGELNQIEMVEALDEYGCTVNQKLLREVLKDLVQEKIIAVHRGKGNELRYS